MTAAMAIPAAAVSLMVSDRRWREAVPGLAALLRRAVAATLCAEDVDPASEVSVLLGDDHAMRALNARWRGQDRPTNVLSFAAGGDVAAAPGSPRFLGDVALGFDTVMREAKDQGKTVADHLSHLVVHAALHLLGHDHQRARDARAMEALEARILAGLGIADPYTPARPALPARPVRQARS